MNSERIKEIQETTAYPDSVSVQQALLQVWNECAQDNEKPTYTAYETQDFAEWTSKSKWFYDDDGKWYQEEARWIDNEPVGFSTAQLRELWEKERGEK